MTIVSKDAEASSGPSDSKSAPNYQPIEASTAPPPSYADTQAEASTSTQIALPRPTNFMSLDRSYGDIKETWVIDTDLKIPDALLPSMGLFGSLSPRPNLGIHTAYGQIRVSVTLVSSSSSRAFIKADTEWGNVTFQVSRLGSEQPYKLATTTKYGNMIIALPRDYIGPLRYKTSYGKIKFSPDLKTEILEMSGENCFVGHFDQSGFVDYKTWKGDEVELNTNYGDISFMYIDELEALGPSFGEKVGGTMKSVLGWFGLGK